MEQATNLWPLGIGRAATLRALGGGPRSYVALACTFRQWIAGLRDIQARARINA